MLFINIYNGGVNKLKKKTSPKQGSGRARGGGGLTRANNTQNVVDQESLGLPSVRNETWLAIVNLLKPTNSSSFDK